MTTVETYCTECETVTTEASAHCPECGAEDPWDERPACEFDEDDLPFVFSRNVYNDTYGLWKDFCAAYWGAHGLEGSDVAGLPESFPDMKYCVFEVYFVITESYELEGPFIDKSDALEVTS